MLIDCDTCEVRGAACGDCVVTVLLGPLPGLEPDHAEEAAIDVLAASGLVPPLRLVTPSSTRRGRPPGDSAVSRRASGA